MSQSSRLCSAHIYKCLMFHHKPYLYHILQKGIVYPAYCWLWINNRFDLQQNDMGNRWPSKWIIRTSDRYTEGNEFDPWQQLLVQLSQLFRRGGAVVIVTGRKIHYGGTVGDSRKHDFCWSLRNPLKQGTCISLPVVRMRLWPRSILATHALLWSELEDPGTPPKVDP